MSDDRLEQMMTSGPDCSRLVDRYMRLRKIAWRLNNDILPEYLSKQAFETRGTKLGIMQGETLVFGDMDETNVLMDSCIHDYHEEGGNAVQRYLADAHLDPDSEEYAMVKAMSESFYTLVQVLDVLPGVGVRVCDVLAQREYLLIDIGFSKSAVKGVVVATRLFPFEEFVMTAGAALPVDAETLREICGSILPKFGMADGNYVLVDAQHKADLAAAITRCCLSRGSSDHIEYEDITAEPAVSPVRREPRVHRNAPCPCGSGRKYKKCCGRTG